MLNDFMVKYASFQNNLSERGTGLVSSFGRSDTPWVFR